MSDKPVFAKYFFHPAEDREDGTARQMICSDDHPLMGFYFNSVWYRKPCAVIESDYALAYDELLCFVGQDLENPSDLGCDLCITIAGREYETSKSCMILVPKYVPRGPITIENVHRPFFAYTGGASKERVPVDKSKWRVPDNVDFENYVLHFNGIDRDESEFEVFRLHDRNNNMIAGFGGVFYGKYRWFLPTTPKDMVFSLESHSHTQPEMLHLFGTDPDNPVDLGAQVTMHFMDESYTFDKTTSIFVPSNQPHTPLVINRVDRPFMFFTLMPDCQVYSLDK